jgi:predicted nuclease of predicted toxin-antitoxin system
MGLRLFADHCVATSVIDALSATGSEVLRLREHLATDALDPAVIEKAQQLNCLLLSVNGDFADIVKYPPKNYRGIISLQVRNHPEVLPLIVASLTAYVDAHSEMSHYQGKLFLFEAHRVRVRT